MNWANDEIYDNYWPRESIYTFSCGQLTLNVPVSYWRNIEIERSWNPIQITKVQWAQMSVFWLSVKSCACNNAIIKNKV